jgi:hypothetical protein
VLCDKSVLKINRGSSSLKILLTLKDSWVVVKNAVAPKLCASVVVLLLKRLAQEKFATDSI